MGAFGTIPDNLDNAQLTENAAKLCEIDFDEFDKDFLKYYLNSEKVQHQIMRHIGIGGGVPKLALFRIEKLLLKYPEKTSQKKIAHILSTTDAVIEKTQAAIAKYKAIKQGMLHDLFTRGIDPAINKLRPIYEDAPHLYKPSQLGCIPKGWKTTTILSSTYIKGRIGWQGLRADEFTETGPFLITGTDLTNGSISWNTCYHISERRFNEAPPIQIKNNDVLITKDGTIGKIAFVTNCPEKAILNSGLFVLRCKDDSYFSQHLFYLFSSEIFSGWLAVFQGGSTINHLYQREFERFVFPIPTHDEQIEIINLLKAINSKIETEQAYLHKLQQIKSGLMADLLSGKKKVNVGEEPAN